MVFSVAVQSQKINALLFPGGRCLEDQIESESILANALLDERGDRSEIFGGECAYTSIDRQARDLVHFGEVDL